MRDVNSSDIIPIWEDIRIEDIPKLYSIAWLIVRCENGTSY